MPTYSQLVGHQLHTRIQQLHQQIHLEKRLFLCYKSMFHHIYLRKSSK